MKTKFGVLGPAGSNGHAASSVLVDHIKDSEVEFYPSHHEMLEDVSSGNVPLCVVPIENSSEGYVSDVMRFFMSEKALECQIVREAWLKIYHAVLMHPQSAKINRLFSRQEAYWQCREKIDELGDIPFTPLSSTSAAAKLVQESDPALGYAAIASEFAAKKYNLKVVRSTVNGSKDNATRFYLVAHKLHVILGEDHHDKLAIRFDLENKPGALAEVLQAFKLFNANVTVVNSIPTGPRGVYSFFLEANVGQKCKMILECLPELTTNLRVLGVFPESSRLVLEDEILDL